MTVWGASGQGVSRREFLKLAAIGGATIGAGATFGGLLAACGSEEATVTTAAPSATTTAATAVPASTATTAAVSTTSASASAEEGDEVRIGMVSPVTGSLAALGIPDKYCIARAEEALVDGLVCGDGKKHPVRFISYDSQSDSNRASQVAGDLIMNDKVSMILVASTAATIVPVADQAETNGVPCLSTEAPWQNYVGARSRGDLTATFDWTYHASWGMEDLVPTFGDVWDQFPNNKKAAVPLSNDDVGQTYSTLLKKTLPAIGYTGVFPDLYQPGTEDFTSLISTFKKEACEVGFGTFTPPDFANFWSQSHQQSWQPKTFIVGVALATPEAAAMLKDLVINLGTPMQWSPSFPYKSALLGGETCQQFADTYSQDTGPQWNQALCHFAIFDWAVDALKRAKSIDSQAIIDAVKTTNIETISGTIDFTAPIVGGKPGVGHNHPNNYKMPFVVGQWRKAEKWPYDLAIVSNKTAPMIAVQGKPEALVY